MNDLLIPYHSLDLNGRSYHFLPVDELLIQHEINPVSLPFSMRVLIEGMARHSHKDPKSGEHLHNLLTWLRNPKSPDRPLIQFHPGRVILQDLTGVPVLVDLASMRSGFSRNGRDPLLINPQIPVDLVIDHSIQVDYFGSPSAYDANLRLEYSRNRERYQFLKWAQQAFTNLRVIPPGKGIIHQVNLEYLAPVVQQNKMNDMSILYPDTVIGTDSHTTMINGLGVLGWGVGGIEAIAAMLEQPIEMPLPEIVGVRIIGTLHPPATPTDIVLTLTRILRQTGVVNKFVEFTGEGLDQLSVPDRAMLANMSPEYGATAAYFPIDARSITYMLETGRDEDHVNLVNEYYHRQGLFRESTNSTPIFDSMVTLDLSQIVPTLAGPKRPQDSISLTNVPSGFRNSLQSPVEQRGYNLDDDRAQQTVSIEYGGRIYRLTHGSVVLAAITSCTNTSNPTALLIAGLLARNARSAGLDSLPYVKTSFSPGSRVAIDYLQKADLLHPLEELGFYATGFGCMTCIGNSGPLPDAVAEAIQKGELVAASVLSGNRNFEGRVHPLIQANYLASPALVVAYAIAGDLNIDLSSHPVGINQDGQPVMLKDIWPSQDQVEKLMKETLDPETYRKIYREINTGDPAWNSLSCPSGHLYPWDPKSTYLRETPFNELKKPIISGEFNGRVLAIFGDSITTDHISPAGAIQPASPAAGYLDRMGVAREQFNSYGSRRGNHEVMVRGTFANHRIRNMMTPDVIGGVTIHYPDGKKGSIFDIAMQYQQEKIGLIILAGQEYGTGSSRDWAAKGTLLLGVRAVIAESFERIHRSNLVQMGILPLQFNNGQSAKSLNLCGEEQITISGLSSLSTHSNLLVKAINGHSVITFQVKALLNSENEIDLIRRGGVYHLIDDMV